MYTIEGTELRIIEEAELRGTSERTQRDSETVCQCNKQWL